MSDPILAAAEFLHRAWCDAALVDAIPAPLRPADDAAGYAVQDALVARLDGDVVGFKIAATSAAGQAHIAVDGPISGQLRAGQVFAQGAVVPMRGNHMRVAEAEFVFAFGYDVAPGNAALGWPDISPCVSDLHLGIEIPNARYRDFSAVGAAQLIADNACAHAFVLGPAVPERWRELDLAAHPVALRVDGVPVSRGHGGDALGDPREALAWFVNHYRARGRGLERGQFVTTGVCGKPAPVRPGQRVCADFGDLGTLEAVLATTT